MPPFDCPGWAGDVLGRSWYLTVRGLTLLGCFTAALSSCSLFDSTDRPFGVLAAGHVDVGVALFEITERGVRRVTSPVLEYHWGFARHPASGALFWSRQQRTSNGWTIEKLGTSYRLEVRLASDTVVLEPGIADELLINEPLVVTEGGAHVASGVLLRSGSSVQHAVLLLDAATLSIDSLLLDFVLLTNDRTTTEGLFIARPPQSGMVFRWDTQRGTIDTFAVDASVFIASGPTPHTVYGRGPGTLQLRNRAGEVVAESPSLEFGFPPNLRNPPWVGLPDSLLALGDGGGFETEGTGVIELLNAFTLARQSSLTIQSADGSARCVRALSLSRAGADLLAFTTTPFPYETRGVVRTYAIARQRLLREIGPIEFPLAGAFW